MLSSMTPSFMIGKDKISVLGGKGGSRIITMVLLGMLGIEQGQSSQQIVALPRFHHQYLPDEIFTEPNALTPETLKTLEAMGHKVTVSPTRWTTLMHSVDWDVRSNTLNGGADPRNEVGSAIVVPKTPAKK